MIYDGLSKPSILHLPTSFFKQILTPSRFTVVAVAVRWCLKKNANFTLYHFIVLWLNDAIFNLKCKTKVTERGRSFKVATNFFARLGMVFWACSRFILSQWMKILSKYFAGFDLGVFRNADLNRLISSEKQK